MTPALVKADSLLDLPGDPLTARGIMAASQFAKDHYRHNPGCRLVFSNGDATRWVEWQHLSRPMPRADGEHQRNDTPGPRIYAVAVEVASTTPDGKRFITSVPIDATTIIDMETKRLERDRAALAARMAEMQATRSRRMALYNSGMD